MSEFRYKPISESKGTLAVLVPSSFGGNISSLELVDSQGNVVDTGRYRGATNGNRPTFDFGQPGYAYPQGVQVRLTTDSGEQTTFDPYSGLKPGERGPGGTGGGTFTGGGGAFNTAGTAFPTYLGGLYPQFQPVKFPTIETAEYNFTDPQKFAEGFADFNRTQIGKGFEQSKDFALQTLDTELKGLQGFAPAAAALSREQTSLDNLFNQMQRTQQVNQVLPEARSDLEAQRRRANIYAEGRLPDEQLNTAFELGIRSRAADQAGFAGFGAESAQAAKISDLMSAEQRFQIAQYGEQALTSNLGTTANLFLAPTQYAQTGAQIRPTPEVGAGRLTTTYLPLITQQTTLDPAQALQTTVQQEQFKTSLEDQTRRYNSTGQFSASTFNSANQFAADLGRFGYEVSYANADQAARQSQLDFANNLAYQEQTAELAGEVASSARNNQTIQGLGQGLGSILGGIGSIIGGSTNQAPPPAATTTDTGIVKSNLVSQPLDVPELQPQEAPTPQAQEQKIATLDIPQTQATQVRSVDASIPTGVKIAAGAPAPSGYVPVATNRDGTYSAVPSASYAGELDRFARNNNVPQQSIDLSNLAMTDRIIADSAGLSFVPVPRFPQIALTGSGNPVYSTPGDAQSGNYLIGATRATGLVESLARMGITDPEIIEGVAKTGFASSDPKFLQELAGMSKEEITAALQEKYGGDPTTAAGQRTAFAAQRIGEIYQGLSPYQRSAAISSMMSESVEAKTGKKIANQLVPGTERSPIGALKAGDVIQLESEGQNGFAVARNWNELSAFTDMAYSNQKTKSVRQVANFADAMGMTGFGPQGAAVPVSVQQLKAAGGVPVPEFGVGAMTFNSVAGIPKDYKVVSQAPDGKPIAVPKNLADTSGLTNSKSPALTYEKTMAIGQGKHPAQKFWGSSPTSGVPKGSVGGSAVISGLSTLKQSNPRLLGAITAYSLFNETMGA